MVRQSLFSSPILAGLFCLCLSFFPSLVHANAGQLIFARGDVSIVGTDGEARPGRIGAAVREGDHILTGANTMAQLRLSDGALVSLRSHSDYQIEVQRQDEGLLEQAGKLFSGWMRSVSGSIGQSDPDSVSFRTPVATIGIRGTTFQVIHIPEGGLPGYEDTPPGTYIYLEEGGIETTTEGGSRYIQPGQVVWVPDRNGKPRLAPERRGLFLAHLGRRADEGDRRRLRGVLERRENREERDRIADALLSGFLNSARPAALGIYGDFFGSRVRSIAPNLYTFGSGSNTVVAGMRMPGGTDGGESFPELRVRANEGAMPDAAELGGYNLASGAAISWGTWTQGNYTVLEDGVPLQTFGDWQYIWTDHALFDATDILSLGITGRFSYGYVGGTSLTGAGGIMDITGGRLAVDFGTRGIFADITVVDGSGIPTGFYGSGSFAEFYGSGGIGLDQEGSTGFGFGSMQGIFAGSTADGVLTSVDISFGSSGSQGVAAFARDGFYRYNTATNVVAAAVGYGGAVPVESGGFAPSLQWAGFGDSRILYAFLDQGLTPQDSDFRLTAVPGSVPGSKGFHSLADGTEINWGVWSAADYEITEIQPNGTESPVSNQGGDWHYMMANNIIRTEQGLLDTGLSGTMTYSYVGGSQLTSPSGANPYTVNSGTIDVIFGGSVSMNVQGINLSGPAGPLNLTTPTAVPVTDFFGNGILLDTGDPNSSASMSGAFAGAAAEGILSTIELSDGAVNDYIGTAAFER